MVWIGDSVDSFKSTKIRPFLTQLINLGLFVSSVVMMWKVLMCITGTESPVVVVLHESMEPGFKPGDFLFLYINKNPIRAGEIVVFNIQGRDISFGHRVIKVHEPRMTGEVKILTKGDGNNVDDRVFLYARGEFWLKRQDIVGRVVGYLPYLGRVSIIMAEKPIIKYIFLCLAGLLVVTE